MHSIYRGNRQNFLSIWTVFCAFTPQKIQKYKKKFLSCFISQETYTTLFSFMVPRVKWYLQTFFTFSKFWFYRLLGKNQKFWKNEKNICRYYHLLLIYGVWQILFLILGHFLSSYPPPTPPPLTAQKIKMKIKNEKKTPGDIITLLTQVYQKPWSDEILFLRYGMWQM